MQQLTMKDVTARTNNFIVTITAKANSPSAHAEVGGSVKDAKPPRPLEPVFESFEQALAAGLLCTKCVATQAGTKGCRACMGEWFESLRQKAAKSNAASSNVVAIDEEESD